jgi:hypothetical protein
MKKIIYTSLFVSLLASGCGSVKMSVSDELKASNDEYVVKGKNGTRIKQKLSFGEYFTTDIKRSWIKGQYSRFGIASGGPSYDQWVNIISLEYIRKKQTIRFNLSDGKNNSDVYCVSRFNARELEIGKSPNSLLNIGIDVLGIMGRPSDTYYVQIFADNHDARPWELSIDNYRSQASPKKYIGYLAKSSTEYYSIVPVTRMEKNGKSGNILAGSIGFEFRDPQGKPVAAVSQLDKGMVFLGKIGTEERFLLANACAALLLRDMIE